MVTMGAIDRRAVSAGDYIDRCSSAPTGLQHALLLQGLAVLPFSILTHVRVFVFFLTDRIY